MEAQTAPRGFSFEAAAPEQQLALLRWGFSSLQVGVNTTYALTECQACRPLPRRSTWGGAWFILWLHTGQAPLMVDPTDVTGALYWRPTPRDPHAILRHLGLEKVRDPILLRLLLHIRLPRCGPSCTARVQHAQTQGSFCQVDMTVCVVKVSIINKIIPVQYI